MKASKLVYNTNNYQSVSGCAQTGINVIFDDIHYYFGLEEWNNSKVLKKFKLAYLDSFRSHNRIEIIDCILLFSFKPVNRQVYFIGFLKKVEQIKDNEIEGVKQQLIVNDWLNIVQNDFNAIGDNRNVNQHQEYMNCWESDNIVANTGKAFILNIKYKEANFFKEENYINLTQIDPRINQKWKRLSVLYNLPNDLLMYIKEKCYDQY